MPPNKRKRKIKTMQDQQKQLVERLKQAQNILVTVSTNPSVDQLAAAIGLTVALNKLDKHATAVFSGEVPSTLDFLKPEETIETNTDSLRDFIIALDKSKADKLRYKVEDNVVRIFITPYRTSISEKDLEFSQGDFNVDVVVGLGVKEQSQLDAAITAHGRILHDATVASINTETGSELGSLNWVESDASSLSEMVVSLVDGLDKKVLDSQIATALLTGIVATTERFRNDKTTPKTMSASAELMAAGANQQLVATQLETPAEPPVESGNQDNSSPQDIAEDAGGDDGGQPVKKPEPGTLEINHEAGEPESPADESTQLPADKPAEEEPQHPQVHIDENGRLMTLGQDTEPLPGIGPVRGVSNEGEVTESTSKDASHSENHERMTEPPANGAPLTANTSPENLDPSTEELTLPPVDSPPFLTHGGEKQGPTPPPEPVLSPEAPAAPPITPDETLNEIEAAVHSEHLNSAEAAPAEKTDETQSVDAARAAVDAAPDESPETPVTPQNFNAQILEPGLHPDTPAGPPMPGVSEPEPGNTPADAALDMPLPGSPLGPSAPAGPPSAFPGAPQPPAGNQPGAGDDGLPPPPPVPPPPIFPHV
jgi:hypothetical protein